jgi:hypothetical protein
LAVVEQLECSLDYGRFERAAFDVVLVECERELVQAYEIIVNDLFCNLNLHSFNYLAEWYLPTRLAINETT